MVPVHRTPNPEDFRLGAGEAAFQSKSAGSSTRVNAVVPERSILSKYSPFNPNCASPFAGCSTVLGTGSASSATEGDPGAYRIFVAPNFFAIPPSGSTGCDGTAL